MDIRSDARFEIQPSDFINAINGGHDVGMQFVYFEKSVEHHFHVILRRFLEKHDMLYLRDVLITILKELVANATKANAKRLYFQTKGLDITVKHDYIEGMNTFKSDVLHTDSEILRQLGQTNMRVKVAFQNTEQLLRLSVINNTHITEEELNKIEARIRKAYRYSDITDAFADVLDDSEGAGLGLIMAMMVFKNAGFAHEDFRIYAQPNRTVCSVQIHKRSNQTEFQNRIAQEIQRELEIVPSFPEHIRRIEELCNNPEVEIHTIAAEIKKDPALTTSILRLANSAGYATLRKARTIEEAVMIIGIKGIKTMLQASGIDSIVSTRYKRFKTIWELSHKKAYYAQHIAIQNKLGHLGDTAYLAALLLSIGEILLLSANQPVVEKLAGLAGLKNLPSTDLLEEMTLGISYATLGGLVAAQWQFDESLVQAITWHLRPHLAPEAHRDLVYVVHLAHVFAETEKKRYRYEIVDSDVLQFFKINTENDFTAMHSLLQDGHSRLGNDV